jgi:hypothetical protein
MLVETGRLAAALPEGALPPAFATEDDSRMAVAVAVHRAMSAQDLTPYELHERTGLPLDTVQDILDAEFPLTDSEPLTKLEQALNIRLGHL